MDVGVLAVGGEINFHAAYDSNPLVNAMSRSALHRADRIFLSAAAGVGNPVVYVGSKARRYPWRHNGVARRGCAKRNGPPCRSATFTEKLLIEACLELMATDAIVAIQDMGAAGLTIVCSRWQPRVVSASSPFDLDGARARNRHDGVRVHAVGKPGAAR